jgi:hypothetical protein
MKIILKHENDYVERIESTDWETVKMYFVWTNDRTKAKVFNYSDVYPPKVSSSIGMEFSKGFSRGEVIQVS